ncbi:von Willebrand factor type A domain-containing protein [Geopyxis carbonaria]|nr:von Willebrand factor type A domain-containing protein [Geopyxis carbonaria]
MSQHASLRSSSGESLPCLSTHLHTHLLNTQAHHTLTQSFYNTAPSTHHGCVYTFPLYANSTVTSFNAHIGERTVRTLLQPRRLTATPADPPLDPFHVAFSMRLGHIAAGATVRVELVYVHEVMPDPDGTEVRLIVPAMVTPCHSELPTDLTEQTEGMTVELDVTMPGTIKTISSYSHAVSAALSVDGAVAAARMVGAQRHLERDFVVVAAAAGLGRSRAFAATDAETGGTTIVATLVPPFVRAAQPTEIVIVADRSGSMEYNMPALRGAMRLLLNSLPANGDVCFNICSFGFESEFLWPQSCAYSAETLAAASQYIDQFEADFGGTEMMTPLQETVRRRLPDGRNLNIMFLTDGESYDEDVLIDWVGGTAQGGSVRFFSMAIGEDVSHSLVAGVAKAGRGSAQSVAAYGNEVMNRKVMRLLKAVLTPNIESWHVDWPGKSEAEAQKSVLQAPAVIPPLFPRAPKTVYFHLLPGVPIPSELTLTGRTNTGKAAQVFKIPVQHLPPSERSSPLPQLFAKQYLKDIAAGMYQPVESEDAKKEEAEKREAETEYVERRAIEVSIEFSVATRWAEFVPVEDDAAPEEASGMGERALGAEAWVAEQPDYYEYEAVEPPYDEAYESYLVESPEQDEDVQGYSDPYIPPDAAHGTHTLDPTQQAAPGSPGAYNPTDEELEALASKVCASNPPPESSPQSDLDTGSYVLEETPTTNPDEDWEAQEPVLDPYDTVNIPSQAVDEFLDVARSLQPTAHSVADSEFGAEEYDEAKREVLETVMDVDESEDAGVRLPWSQRPPSPVPSEGVDEDSIEEAIQRAMSKAAPSASTTSTALSKPPAAAPSSKSHSRLPPPLSSLLNYLSTPFLPLPLAQEVDDLGRPLAPPTSLSPATPLYTTTAAAALAALSANPTFSKAALRAAPYLIAAAGVMSAALPIAAVGERMLAGIRGPQESSRPSAARGIEAANTATTANTTKPANAANTVATRAPAPQFSAPVLSRPPKPRSTIPENGPDPLAVLLGPQRFDGAFGVVPELAEAMGVAGAVEVDMALWTQMVVRWVREALPEREEEWELVVGKAEEWVQTEREAGRMVLV